MPLKLAIPWSTRPCTGPALVCTTLVGSGTPGPCSVEPGAAAAFLPLALAAAASAGVAPSAAAPTPASPMTSRLSSLFPLMMMFPSQLLLLSFGVGRQLGLAAPLRQAVERVDGMLDGVALLVGERRQARGDAVAADAGHE